MAVVVDQNYDADEEAIRAEIEYSRIMGGGRSGFEIPEVVNSDPVLTKVGLTADLTAIYIGDDGKPYDPADPKNKGKKPKEIRFRLRLKLDQEKAQQALADAKALLERLERGELTEEDRQTLLRDYADCDPDSAEGRAVDTMLERAKEVLRKTITRLEAEAGKKPGTNDTGENYAIAISDPHGQPKARLLDADGNPLLLTEAGKVIVDQSGEPLRPVTDKEGNVKRDKNGEPLVKIKKPGRLYGQREVTVPLSEAVRDGHARVLDKDSPSGTRPLSAEEIKAASTKITLTDENRTLVMANLGEGLVALEVSQQRRNVPLFRIAFDFIHAIRNRVPQWMKRAGHQPPPKPEKPKQKMRLLAIFEIAA